MLLCTCNVYVNTLPLGAIYYDLFQVLRFVRISMVIRSRRPLNSVRPIEYGSNKQPINVVIWKHNLLTYYFLIMSVDHSHSLIRMLANDYDYLFIWNTR